MLFTDTPAGTVVAHIAIAREDLADAERLLHDVYVARGLRDAMAPRHSSVRATVFVARVDGTVGATLSLMRDSTCGLPSDTLYGAELAALRARGRRVAEVSALAVDPSRRGAALGLVRPLVQLVGIYARDVGSVDELCIAVHPRHASFYAREFGFSRFGGEKAYDAVNGAPAVGLRLDLHQPPTAGVLSGVLFRPREIARVRAALASDLRCRVAPPARLMKIFQFSGLTRALHAGAPLEVC